MDQLYIKSCTHEDSTCVLVGVSVAVIKSHGQSHLGKRGFFLPALPHHSPSLKDSGRSGTRGQELKQKPRGVLEGVLLADWLAQPAFL